MIETSFLPGTADGLAGLRRARERFLADREVPAGVPAWLAAAWRRALFHDVDVERPDVPAARTPPRPPATLLAAARPVLAHLGETLAGLDVGVVLADARGRVVDCWADAPVRRRLEAIQTRPGADLAESSTGVNALCHVLGTGRPALIAGPQHLFGLYQDTACAGAPVRDPLTGRVEAALALVSAIDAPAALLESLAVTTATGIEREILHRAAARERHLVDAYLAARGRGSPVAALDGRTRLVSDAAAALVGPDDLDVLELRAVEILAGRRPDALTLDGSGVRADFDAVPGTDGDAGVLVRLTALVPAARAGGSSPRTLRDAGLVGGSAEWLALERAAARVAGTPGPVLVHGERGAGKTVTALAVVGGDGPAPAVVTAWDHDECGFVRALRAIDDDAPLVVRHGERLTSPLVHATADVLRGRSGRSAVTLVTAGEGDGSLATWRTAAITGELPVPPLRDRGADVTALVDHVAAITRVRLARDARDALRAYPWPGNVAEVEHVMAAVGGGDARGGVPVAMADLPAHVRRPGRSLGALERAERDTVVAALAASGGNKKRAASRLGVSRATLYRKMRVFGL